MCIRDRGKDRSGGRAEGGAGAVIRRGEKASGTQKTPRQIFPLQAEEKDVYKRQVEGLSSVLVNFLWPAMVVDAMARVQADRELVRQAGQAAVWALIIICLLYTSRCV